MIDFTFLAAEQSTDELLVQAEKDYNSARRVWWTLTGALAGMGVAYLAKQPNGVQVVAGAIGGGGAYLLTKKSEEKAASTAVAGSREQIKNCGAFAVADWATSLTGHAAVLFAGQGTEDVANAIAGQLVGETVVVDQQNCQVFEPDFSQTKGSPAFPMDTLWVVSKKDTNEMRKFVGEHPKGLPRPLPKHLESLFILRQNWRDVCNEEGLLDTTIVAAFPHNVRNPDGTILAPEATAELVLDAFRRFDPPPGCNDPFVPPLARPGRKYIVCSPSEQQACNAFNG